MRIFADIIDTYESPVEIGKGGAGTVYKSYHKRLRKDVVLKKINVSGQNREYVRKEVDILKELNNRFIPQVYDVVMTETEIYTVMSFVPGKTFQQVVNEGAQFNDKQIKKWSRQLLSVLDYLHTRKPAVIHGDIKPSNVMLKPDGDICLIDFNISLKAGEGSVSGYTPGFASPEQYHAVRVKAHRQKINGGGVVIDARSDIYSLGAFLYYIATGKKKAYYSDDIDFRALERAVGFKFASAVKKAMAIDPAERFSSAKEMLQAISGDSETKRKATIRFGKNRIIIAAAIVVAVFIGGAAAMMGIQNARYGNIVEAQTEYIDGCNFTRAQAKFDEAADIRPRKLDAYYQYVRSLYAMGNYEDCLDYIENSIFDSRIRIKGDDVGDLYILAGICSVMQDEGAAAVNYYERALKERAFTGNDYRDYAVALSHAGKYDKADDMLEKAQRMGAAEGSAEYVKGEKSYSKKEYDSALESMDACLNAAEDEELILHAYCSINRINRDRGNLSNSRKTLMEAKETVGSGSRAAVIHELVNVDIDLAEETGEENYRAEAASLLNELVERDWASKEDYHSLAVMYIKMDELEKSESIIDKRGEELGKDYDYYKLKAINETHKQNALSEEDRDYDDFVTYYNMAKSEYDESLNDNEMSVLDDIYNRLKEGGWI